MDCVCGNPEGTNKECERCRLLNRIAADELLLRQALSQLIAMTAEFNNALGSPASQCFTIGSTGYFYGDTECQK